MDIAKEERVWPEGEIPQHSHTYDWEDNGDAYESYLIGVVCTFSWLIPPGPRGKKPRTRSCREFKDMDEVLSIVNTVVGGELQQ